MLETDPSTVQCRFHRVSWLTNGRSFSSSNLTGNSNLSALSAGETAAAFLPASLFQLITGQDDVGIFFALYDTGVLFPITNNTQTNLETNSFITTVVGSPVLAATVGPGLVQAIFPAFAANSIVPVATIYSYRYNRIEI